MTVPGVSLRAQTPVLEYDFDTTGTAQTSTGSDHLALTTVASDFTPTNYVSDSLVGPSGKPGDKTLNFSEVSNAGGAQAGSSSSDGSVSSDSNLTTGLSSFTITGWVSNITPNGHVQTLFALVNNIPIPVPVVQFGLYGAPGSASSRLQFSTNNRPGIVSDFGGTGTEIDIAAHSATWDFIAVTYNARTGSVTFYHGVNGGLDVNSYAPTNTQPAPVSSSITSCYVGNAYYTMGNTGSISGALDAVGFYNSALTTFQINTIFKNQGSSR